MKKQIYTIAIVLMMGLAATAQTTVLANFDFNQGSVYPYSPATFQTNIVASLADGNGTPKVVQSPGTATGSQAFVQNSLPDKAIVMPNSSGTNTEYWTLSLSGSALNTYTNFKIYFQSDRSNTGATIVTVFYSTDGSNFTAFGTTANPGLEPNYTEAVIDLSSVTALNNQPNLYFRFAASGTTNTNGKLRIENLQVEATQSTIPQIDWQNNGSNIFYLGGNVGINNTNPAYALDVNGDGHISNNLYVNNAISIGTGNPILKKGTSGELIVQGNSILQGNSFVQGSLNVNSLGGSGTRFLQTDFAGNILPFAMGTSSQVLYGNGTWGALPVNAIQTSGSNAYFMGGNFGLGTQSPQYPLDVAGNANVSGNLTVAGSASFDSIDAGYGIRFNGKLGISYQDAQILGHGKIIIPSAINLQVNNTTVNGNLDVSGTATLNQLNIAQSISSPKLVTSHISAPDTNGVHIGDSSMVFVSYSSLLYENMRTGTSTVFNTGSPPSGHGISIGSLAKAFGSNSNYLDGSIAIGSLSNAHAIRSYAFGYSTLTTASYAMALGNGVINNTSNSLAVGFNSTAPTLFVGGGTGGASIGKIGIGTITPSSQLEISTAIAAAGHSLLKVKNTSLPISQPYSQTLFEVMDNGQTYIGVQTNGAKRQNSLTGNHSTAMLTVNGDIVVGTDNSTGTGANLWVTESNWADFVFDTDYKLMPLNEVEKFYKANHHLPAVPSQKEIQEQGNNLGQTDVVLLQKIEELTLYMVKQQKQLEAQQKLIETLSKKLEEKK